MRKYKGTYKIPIKKHTKVRRPMSKYIVSTKGDVLFCSVTHRIISGRMIPVGAVQDIKRGLENPIWCNGIYQGEELLRISRDGFAPKQQKGDLKSIDEWSKDWADAWYETLNERIEHTNNLFGEPKPKSLLERMKARFK